MGRARNTTRLAAVAGRHHIGDETAADPFSMVMGSKRSGRGERPADLSNDQSLLDHALAQLPASDVFAHVSNRFTSPSRAYQSDEMRVLANISTEEERCYLVAGYANALSSRVGQQAFSVFTLFADVNDEDDVLLIGDTANLDKAVTWLNQCANSAGSQESMTSDQIRSRLRPLIDNVAAEPVAVTTPDLDPELETILDELEPAPRESHWGSNFNHFSSPEFAYDHSSFRVLYKHSLPDDKVYQYEGLEGTTGYVVAGRADGFGPRAGSEAYVTFFMTLSRGLFLAGESDTLDDAVALLNKQMRNYVPEEFFTPVAPKSVRAGIAARRWYESDPC